MRLSLKGKTKKRTLGRKSRRSRKRHHDGAEGDFEIIVRNSFDPHKFILTVNYYDTVYEVKQKILNHISTYYVEHPDESTPEINKMLGNINYLVLETFNVQASEGIIEMDNYKSLDEYYVGVDSLVYARYKFDFMKPLNHLAAKAVIKQFYRHYLKVLNKKTNLEEKKAIADELIHFYTNNPISKFAEYNFQTNRFIDDMINYLIRSLDDSEKISELRALLRTEGESKSSADGRSKRRRGKKVLKSKKRRSRH
jgi:hypothetical protein